MTIMGETGRRVATTAVAMEQSPVLTAVDFPPPHLIEFGRENRFRGMVLDSHGRVARGLRVQLDDEPPREFPANQPSEDLAVHLPQLPAARNCRFDFQIFIPESSSLLTCEAIWQDSSAERLFDYDLAAVREFATGFDRMRQLLETIAVPPGEIVFLTQGHRDADAYRHSIIPGLWNMRRYLAACAVNTDDIRRVLDFGCGSGRLLTGWSLEGEDRVLVGCDPNAVLTEWARVHLPSRIRIDHTPVLPPLPYAEAEFDFVFAVSVLTHLRYRTQQVWVQELARTLKPGGILLLTAHGPIYVKLFAPTRVAEFDEEGHLEVEGAEDGSNELASFHAPRNVAALLDQFELLGYFPEGRIDGKRTLFPIAGLQDVYVLRRR